MNKPLKRFGQNYLIDKNIINKIIEEINPQQEDTIIEIGPGRGALTEYLVLTVTDFTAVEIDSRVINSLKNKYPSLKILNIDFLELELSKFAENQKIKIAGNIPYNLTSSILFKMIKNRKYVSEAVLMVQYEVAKRMAAGIGSKNYGILSVLLSAFGRIKFCFKVSPNVFRPRPNVFSAVVHIYFNNESLGVDDQLFINIVKSAFGSRRKILKNSLSNGIFANYDFSESGINLSRRAEELNTKEFIMLAASAQNQ